MNLTERVAVALLRERYRRNMGHPPDLTDEAIFTIVAEDPESLAGVLADSRAAVDVVLADGAHDPERCQVCKAAEVGR